MQGFNLHHQAAANDVTNITQDLNLQAVTHYWPTAATNSVTHGELLFK